MPLLRYFVFVGSALLGLIYLVGSVFTHDTPTHIDSKSEAPSPQPPPRQPQHTIGLAPRTEPALASTVPDGATPETGALPESTVAPAPVAKETPPRKKRKPAPRKQEWQDSFAQADGWRRDQRRWTDRGRGDNGWRSNSRRNDGWRNQGSRDPFWGSNWRGPGWR